MSRGRGRRGEREKEADSPLSVEPDAGFDPHDPEIMTYAKIMS